MHVVIEEQYKLFPHFAILKVSFYKPRKLVSAGLFVLQFTEHHYKTGVALSEWVSSPLWDDADWIWPPDSREDGAAMQKPRTWGFASHLQKDPAYAVYLSRSTAMEQS